VHPSEEQRQAKSDDHKWDFCMYHYLGYTLPDGAYISEDTDPLELPTKMEFRGVGLDIFDSFLP
jgi:hypothetical protein